MPVNFLNPHGLSLRALTVGLKERYNFSSSPIEKPTTEKDGAQFQAGEFVLPDGRNITINMTIHGDGIVIETRSSTDDGDLFLEDALTWCHSEFRLPAKHELPMRMLYSSDIYVQFPKLPSLYNEKTLSLMGAITAIIGDDKVGLFDFQAFNLVTDPEKSDRTKSFRFEREINIPFSENRFYSSAPTTTSNHLKILDLIDEIG